jgi:hypothetical protein
MTDTTVKTMLGRMPWGTRITILFYFVSAQERLERTGRFRSSRGTPGEGLFVADGSPPLVLRVPSTDLGLYRVLAVRVGPESVEDQIARNVMHAGRTWQSLTDPVLWSGSFDDDQRFDQLLVDLGEYLHVNLRRGTLLHQRRPKTRVDHETFREARIFQAQLQSLRSRSRTGPLMFFEFQGAEMCFAQLYARRLRAERRPRAADDLLYKVFEDEVPLAKALRDVNTRDSPRPQVTPAAAPRPRRHRHTRQRPPWARKAHAHSSFLPPLTGRAHRGARPPVQSRVHVDDTVLVPPAAAGGKAGRSTSTGHQRGRPRPQKPSSAGRGTHRPSPLSRAVPVGGPPPHRLPTAPCRESLASKAGSPGNPHASTPSTVVCRLDIGTPSSRSLDGQHVVGRTFLATVPASLFTTVSPIPVGPPLASEVQPEYDIENPPMARPWFVREVSTHAFSTAQRLPAVSITASSSAGQLAATVDCPDGGMPKPQAAAPTTFLPLAPAFPASAVVPQGSAPSVAPQPKMAPAPPPPPPGDSPEYVLDISPVPVSGGDPLPFASNGLRKRKLISSQKENSLPLAPTTSNRIDVDKLAADGLADVLAPIREVSAFEALFDDAATAKRLRPLSRDMFQHTRALIQNDVVEPVIIPLPSGRRRPVAERFLILTWCSTFLVRKKNGTGRFIVDARPINRAQKPPPDMGLPRIGTIIRDVLKHDLAAKTDGVSYFYQFPLAAAIRPYFKIRLARSRGRYANLQLKRMPMGWKYAPMIAQQVSNHLIRSLGRAWLDDFILLGMSDTFDTNRDTFLERLKTYNVEVDNTELEPTKQLKALGLEFDLETKQFRLDPDWVAKRTEHLNGYLEATKEGKPTTVRQFLEVMGSLVWAAYVREVPLWQYAECLAALSAAAKLELEELFECPSYAVRNLQSWIGDVSTNEWCAPTDRPATFNDYIFSDASDTMAAFIQVSGDQITSGDAWRLPPEQKIFLSEVEAITRGAPRVDIATTLFGTDNAAANFAMRKGHSSSYVANVLFRKAFGQSRPWSSWVPTYLQPADKFTRGVALPRMPCQADADPDVQRAIAFISQLDA